MPPIGFQIEARGLPLTLRCVSPAMYWLDAAQSLADIVATALSSIGAVLIRGIDVPATCVERFLDLICIGDPVDYREPSTPRRHVSGSLFTSTEYDRRRLINLHNENAHVMSFPAVLAFYCEMPAGSGGSTPLADCRAVLRSLPVEIRERFFRHGWIYQRSFGYGLGFPWRSTFGVDDRDGLELYMTENFMSGRWNGDKLQVRYRRWSELVHPVTGEDVWFNHGAFNNVHALEPGLRRFIEVVGRDNMPYDTMAGDGSSVSRSDIDAILRAYRINTRRFDWESGDVLLIDNLLIAHGRDPFAGDRRVLVQMKRRLTGALLAPREIYDCSESELFCND